MNKSKNKGAIALPTVIILASVLLAIGLAINQASYDKIEAIKNSESALGALYIAESGMKDAMERVVRNKNYSTDYTIQISSGSANIVFEDFPPPNQIIITSTGTLGVNEKKLQASFGLDDSGKLTQISWQEIL